MKNKALQKFSDSSLEHSKNMSPDEIILFLEQYQEVISGKDSPRKLISLRVPENLLNAFKQKARSEGKPYQTRLIELMREYIKS